MVLANKDIIGASFACGGKVKLNPSWNTKNVICPESKFFYITDGELYVKTEKELIFAKSGDMVLIPAGVKHDFYLSEKNYAEKYWMHFNLKYGNADYFEKHNTLYLVKVGKNVYAEKLFKEILKRASKGENTNDLAISGMICLMIDFYASHGGITRKKNDLDEINRVAEFLKKNYDKSFSLKKLAAMARLSPNYFVRKFKEQTGYPPKKYACSVKIEMARFLLQNTDSTVSEIMEKVGFLDSAHFSKTFRLFSGYSPKQYRDIYKNRPFNNNKISE